MLALSAQVPSLDGTFGNQGLSQVAGYGPNASAPLTARLVLQPSGGLVVTGVRIDTDPRPLVIRRYHEDTGVLDTGYGNNGEISVVVNEPDGSNNLQETIVRPDGRVVALVADYGRIRLVQFLPDGGMDPAFGINGTILHTHPAEPYIEVWGLALQPDGRILVTGGAGPYSFVARFHADGTLDTAFGNNGYAIPQPISIATTGRSVAVRADGNILVTGFLNGSEPLGSFFSALDPNGQHLPGFGSNGGYSIVDLIQQTGVPQWEAPRRVVPTPDGGAYIIGRARLQPNGGHSLFISRFLANGQIDTLYADQGTRVIMRPAPIQFGLEQGYVDGTGSLTVISSEGPYASQRSLSMHRFLPDGSYDLSFGDQGEFVLYPYPITITAVTGYALDPFDRLVLLCRTGHWITQQNSAYLMRFNMNLTTPVPETTTSSAHSLHVYPQPASRELTITLPDGPGPWRYALHDAMGRCAWSGVLPAGVAGDAMRIDLPPLANGRYTLRLESPTTVRHAPLLVAQ